MVSSDRVESWAHSPSSGRIAIKIKFSVLIGWLGFWIVLVKVWHFGWLVCGFLDVCLYCKIPTGPI